MTECRRCGGRASAFLCPRCTTKVDTGLRELPWLLRCLTETATGQTRMSDNGGRRSARRKDLDGDRELAACIEPLPPNKDNNLERARREREQHALATALASGRIHARASQLLGEVADGLAFWCRVICEARGIAYVPIRFMGRRFIGPLQTDAVRASRPTSLGGAEAVWLVVHVASIALSEEADDIASDVERWAEEITIVINRPVRYWPLGQCPAETSDGPCEAELPRVPEHTEEVRCRSCRSVHSVSRVLVIRKHEREGEPQTWRSLRKYNRDLPPEFQVPERTLRDWLARGRLAPCGANPEGDPLYSWVDVRLLALDKRLSRRGDKTG